MQYDKSAQQRWRYQGVSEAPGEQALVQPTNAIEYKVIFHAIQYNMLQMIFHAIQPGEHPLFQIHQCNRIQGDTN